uniref:Uncharacterized protein n=1 Tax=Acrobeloides nanus TaxID=290746 RepID=A0A914DUS1_9BILA
MEVRPKKKSSVRQKSRKKLLDRNRESSRKNVKKSNSVSREKRKREKKSPQPTLIYESSSKSQGAEDNRVQT